MSRVDQYRHLNESDPIQMTIPMEELARTIVASNYGSVRLLSAMIHALRESRALYIKDMAERNPQQYELLTDSAKASPLANALEEALNNGLFY